MKHLISFVLFGLFLSISQNVQAQTGQGCHNWCGKMGNNAATGYASSLGKTFGQLNSTERAEALRLKQEKWDQCKADTIHMTEEQCNNQTAATGDVPTPTANPNRCQTEYNDLVQKCDAQVTSSKNTCDETQNSAISSASSSASATNTSTTGVTDSCNTAASLNSSAKTAWTSYRESCYSGMESCVNACNEMITWANSNPSCFPINGMSSDQFKAQVFSPKADQCLNLQSKVDSADRNIASYGTTADGADACKTGTAGGDSKSSSNGNLLGQLGSVAASMLAKQSATATPQAVVAFCTANPSYPGCGASAQQSCSDPTYAATNKVCQCAANPYSCRVVDNSVSGSIGYSSVDSSSRLPSQAANVGGDIPSTPNIAMVDPVRSGDVQGIDGRQGGAGVGSSTVGSGGGSGGLGRANVDPSDVPGGGSMGTFGGGGGGGGRFGSQASGGSRGGYGSNGQNAAGSNGKAGNPDLRQFLPGGSYNPRQNMVGGRVGIDGITGPNSNIWQKVQNRYQVLKDTLHP